MDARLDPVAHLESGNIFDQVLSGPIVILKDASDSLTVWAQNVPQPARC